MPRPHPKELRSRVGAAYEAGEGTQEELAVRFKVGVASVKRWIWAWRDDGRLEHRPMGQVHPRALQPMHEAHLERVVAERPEVSAPELTRQLKLLFGLEVHRSTVKRTLRRLGYRKKKVLLEPSSETALLWSRLDESSAEDKQP